MAQTFKQLKLPLWSTGASRETQRSEQTSTAATGNEGPGTRALMREVVDHLNIERAAKRVMSNKGAPGIDGMPVGELAGWVHKHWPEVREQLLAGTYEPSPVRRVMIPKRGGGERMLGIPTVIDRLIQQAILLVLQPHIDPTFSDHSYGFRPGRSAHDAVSQMRDIVVEGRVWVVDIDLEKFFDRVNHDILMDRLAKRVEDREVLRVIRRYLNAGVMVDGVKVVRDDGTPQGGPLSPLLANVYLDEVDKELEQRGHAFVRYADDLRVLVKSKRAGERVMRWLVKRFGKLKLRVNESKSTVARVYERPFLSFSLWEDKEGRPKIGVASKAMGAMKERVRELTKRTRGRAVKQVVAELSAYLLGWWNYFGITEAPGKIQAVEGWMRRRVRCLILSQYKKPKRAYKALRALGASDKVARRVAAHIRHKWRISTGRVNRVLTNSYLAALGVPTLVK
ncbi:Group II intron-encoded protein LtrA [Enhygromyxa salina]|uniref:RNA-directed DNA polymerase n=1 Tax=Enhygromyxa salina TaxID=215803 RepID=A0A2S9XJ37_9BACT|nr:group II intron reverse transcriptase/maturase [Enhygromyxa salina]PRP92889.1 Group II intron-encoded protein LtrA [Enhygromyxa salina]